jgi:hypothetical protein
MVAYNQCMGNEEAVHVNVYLLYAVDVASVPPGEDLQVLGVSGQN